MGHPERSANAHLSDDETVAKMGHPKFCYGFRCGHPSTRDCCYGLDLGHPPHPPESMRKEVCEMKRILSVTIFASFVLASMSASRVWAQASALSKAVRTSDSMEPALVHPEQAKAAQQKL